MDCDCLGRLDPSSTNIQYLLASQARLVKRVNNRLQLQASRGLVPGNAGDAARPCRLDRVDPNNLQLLTKLVPLDAAMACMQNSVSQRNDKARGTTDNDDNIPPRPLGGRLPGQMSVLRPSSSWADILVVTSLTSRHLAAPVSSQRRRTFA